MILVALTGYAGAGKDALGKILVENHGFVRVAFADAIKRHALALGWDGQKDERGRKFLQTLGTEVVRAYNPNFWVETAMKEAVQHECVVITDCRFCNEVEAVKTNGGVVVRVERPGVGPANEHLSENELGPDDCDLRILNSGTLEDLEQAAALLVQRIEFGEL